MDLNIILLFMLRRCYMASVNAKSPTNEGQVTPCFSREDASPKDFVPALKSLRRI